MTERTQQRLDLASIEAQRLLDSRVPKRLAARLYNQVVAALLQGADGFDVPAARALTQPSHVAGRRRDFESPEAV